MLLLVQKQIVPKCKLNYNIYIYMELILGFIIFYPDLFEAL